MTTRLRLLVTALLAASVLAFSAPAHAQSYYGQPGPPQRRGVIRSDVIFGVGLGLGGIFPADCDGCDGLGAFAIQGHIGGMLGPQLALIFDASALFHVFEDDSTLTSATYLAVLRGWLGDILWLEAGLGIGQLRASDQFGFFEDERFGGAALIGAGVELLQTPIFALDLQLRISGSRFQENGQGFGISNVALLVGFNWY